MKNYLLILTSFLYLNSLGQETDIKKPMIGNATKHEFIADYKHFKAKFETKISNLFKEYNIEGDFIFGIVDETGLVYSYALNKDILEQKPTSLTNESPIYIASHTKAMTGTLLKILEEEGKIDLDKTLYDYLPDLTFNGKVDTKSISIRNLLNHTNGISNGIVTYKTAYFGYSGENKELIDDFNLSSKINPSKKFNYSNIGSILAGMIVERITGNTWKEEMKRRIFEPLGMTNTSANVSDFNYSDIRPAISLINKHQTHAYFKKKDVTMHAAGGVLSTINDLSKWLQININQDSTIFKSLTSWEALHEPTTKQDRTYYVYKRHAYSLGWDIATYQKDTILTRFGGYGDIAFHLSFMPKKKIGIIGLTSDGRASSLSHLAANYAYNLINKIPNAEEIFESEKGPLVRAFDKSNNSSSQNIINDLVLNDENDFFIGVYKNKDGWPDITISKNDYTYEIKWGILEGVIYNISGEKRPYVASFDVLSRSLDIKKTRLFIGGLKYRKTE